MSNKKYFDVSDVVEFFFYHSTASGIQRVQLEFIRNFCTGQHDEVEFVIDNSSLRGFTIANKALLMRLVEGIDAGTFSLDDLRRLVQNIRSSSDLAIAQEGDIFFVSGAFWVSTTVLHSLWRAKEDGAIVGLLCYDLIPLLNKDFVQKGLTDAFGATIEVICHLVDFIFTISDYVRHDVEKYLEQIGLSLPVIALPLAHQLAPQRGSPKLSPDVAAIIGSKYVLFVSTIEVRKNHAYTLAAWQKLLETMPEATPDLIWVGRRGWFVNDLMQRLDNLDYLGGKIRILNDLSDIDLAALYKNCWFTIYPSLAEGWGLPVAESLMFGKPAVVSNAASLPEVGGDFVWYIDPFNITGGVELLSRLLHQPDLIEQAATRIRNEFKPRLWSDVCQNLLVGMATIKSSGQRGRPLPKIDLVSGTLYPAGTTGLDNITALPASAIAAMVGVFDDGWYTAEHWGRWMNGLAGGLCIHTPPSDTPERHLIYLRFVIFSGWKGRSIAVHCPESGEEVVFSPQVGAKQEVLIEMALPPGASTLFLRADRNDGAGATDTRHFSIGLVAFGLYPIKSAESTAKLAAVQATGRMTTLRASRVGKTTTLKPRDKQLSVAQKVPTLRELTVTFRSAMRRLGL